MLKTFKVAGVNSTPNKFGQYPVLIIAEDGECYEIAASEKPKLYQELNVNLTRSGIITEIQGLDYQIPRKLKNAPPPVVDELFKPSSIRLVLAK